MVTRAGFMYSFIQWIITECLLCAGHSARGWKYDERQGMQACFYGSCVNIGGRGPDLGSGGQRKLAPSRKVHLHRKLKDEEELAGGRRWRWGWGCSRRKDYHVQNQLTWSPVISLTLTALVKVLDQHWKRPEILTLVCARACVFVCNRVCWWRGEATE